jgi:hypothetical protein
MRAGIIVPTVRPSRELLEWLFAAANCTPKRNDEIDEHGSGIVPTRGGKNALVTGSRKGLGAAIALTLAEAGANAGWHGKGADSGGVPEAVRGMGRKSFMLRAM